MGKKRKKNLKTMHIGSTFENVEETRKGSVIKKYRKKSESNMTSGLKIIVCDEVSGNEV